jgi:hypothetical protein
MSFFPTSDPNAVRIPTSVPTPRLDLSLLVVEDVTVTGIEDGHGGAAEELAASGAELNL